MPKKDRSQDDANFQNKTPPSSQTELRQMTEQNSANSVIKNSANSVIKFEKILKNICVCQLFLVILQPKWF